MKRSCFGTKEFSKHSTTCNACPDFIKCSEVKLYTKEAAYLYFKRVLERKKIQILQGTPIHEGGKHYLVKTNSQNFYCLYKREFFHSFQNQFPQYMKMSNAIGGAGESINKEALDIAIKNNCLLVFIYQTEKVYCIPANELKEFCEKNNLIRFTNKEHESIIPGSFGSKQITKEMTYSFPVKILQNYLNL